MKLPAKVAFALGVILTVAQGVQLAIHMSLQAHDALTLLIVSLIGVGVLPVTRSQFALAVPLHVLTLITALDGVLQVVQTASFHIGTAGHVIVGVVLVALNSLVTANNVAPTLPSVAKVEQPAAAGPPASHLVTFR